MTDYQGFGKISRLRRPVTVTEKIDGTNGRVEIVATELDPAEETEWVNASSGVHHDAGISWVNLDGVIYTVRAGSRNRWLTPTKLGDNHGFAAWVRDNADVLVHLGPGDHYGEWFGAGIQRGYGLSKKYFALFNAKKYGEFIQNGHGLDTLTAVPTLAGGIFSDALIDTAVQDLRLGGSDIAWLLESKLHQPAEGIVVQHSQNHVRFKVLLENDDVSKTVVENMKGISVRNTGSAVAAGPGSIANSGIMLRSS